MARIPFRPLIAAFLLAFVFSTNELTLACAASCVGYAVRRGVIAGVIAVTSAGDKPNDAAYVGSFAKKVSSQLSKLPIVVGR
ncbi:MAG: hypothetical protein IPH11_16255 [Ignavibacteriales bacterium]|nr:hypothetical protein [Ignavibacteriales bacterium]